MANLDNKIYVLYLDGTDAETEGTFEWSTTNAPLTYSNWWAGEPNNCCGGEDCLIMFATVVRETGSWNDWNCSAPEPSVCEIDTSTRKCPSIT